MRVSKFIACFAFSTLLLSSLTTARAVEPDAPQEILSKDAAIAAKIRDKINDPATIRNKEIRNSLEQYYAERGFSPFWIGRDGLEAHAKQAIKEITRADEYGLRASDYPLPGTTKFVTDGPEAFAKIADADITLSLAVIKYARDARGGRINPRGLSRSLDIKLKLPSPQSVLDGIAKAENAGAYLRKKHPQRREFEALRKRYLALTRTKTKVTSETQIPAGPTLRLGDNHEHVALLRKRLRVKDVTAAPEEFDEAVLDAVVAFQRSKGLSPDGIVGRGTRSALNGGKKFSVGSEATRLLVNMERWRWYPDSFGAFFIRMNIPDQHVEIVKDGKVIHRAKTIIGKVRNKTVVFSDEMEHMVFHPTWNVPNSIKVEEILPYLKKNSGGWLFSNDSDILKAHNLYVRHNGQEIDPSKIDWHTADIRNFHVYQPPGPKNVLGVVKFMFPNRHAIYMHDTTEKKYFKQPVRLHSHGCVRIQDPQKFASVLLNQDKGWASSRVAGYVASNSTNTVNLTRHIPVHLTYFTTWTDRDGNFKSGPDVYGHDKRMAAALKMGRPAQTEPNLVASVDQKPKPKPKKKKKKPQDDYYDDGPIDLMSILQAF